MGIKTHFKLAIAATGFSNRREELFKEIWKENYPGLKIFCRAHLPNDQDIDDVCQEIMLKVFNKLHTYNPFFPFKTWFFTIARNHCIDYRRKKINTETLYNNTVFRSDENPEALFQLSELNKSIDNFMQTRPETDQQIAILRFSEKLKFKEIAEIMRIPSGTIRYRVSEIRSGLKKYLEDRDETE